MLDAAHSFCYFALLLKIFWTFISLYGPKSFPDHFFIWNEIFLNNIFNTWENQPFWTFFEYVPCLNQSTFITQRGKKHKKILCAAVMDYYQRSGPPLPMG